MSTSNSGQQEEEDRPATVMGRMMVVVGVFLAPLVIARLVRVFSHIFGRGNSQWGNFW